MNKLIEVLKLAERHLEQRGVPSARLNAELLLSGALSLDRLGLYLQHDRPLIESELEAFRALIRRRAAREPIQYILGSTGFRGLRVSVGPGVLVPRPETETLVQLVLERLVRLKDVNSKSPGPLKVLDLCTGSGVVGLSLAAENEGLWCLLSDNSAVALGWAVKNARSAAIRPGRLSFCCANLLEAFTGRPVFDAVVANPPYVPPDEIDDLPEEIRRYEPLSALDGGAPDGTTVLGKIIEYSYRVMRKGALLALEIGESQPEALAKVFAASRGLYSAPEFQRDLAGKFRFVTAYKT